MYKYYSGFYINKPVGNNIFSYDERDNKSIFVPTLINGNLEDVLVGDKIVFNEIDEDEFENRYEVRSVGLKNFVYFKYEDKEIYIFDNHNHAFYFWINSLNNEMFTKGCKLVHIDQHKDMREPDNYRVDIYNIEDVFRYTNFVLNVGNFIKPALYHNIFNEVIIIDSSFGFEEVVEGEIVLDIDLDIFSDDMSYLSYDMRIDKIREYIKKSKVITIATSPFFIEQEYAIKVLKELFKN
jgi:hypothetical protein